MKKLKYIIPIIIIIIIFSWWMFSNNRFTISNNANINLTDIELKNTVRYKNIEQLENNIVSESENVEIQEYIEKSNNAIPITTDALKFAIINATIGTNELLLDAISKLAIGKQNLTNINPPKNLDQAHNLSLKLLEKYVTILKDIVNTSNEVFNPLDFENEFIDIEEIVKQIEKILGGRKLKILRFYWEAIGK